VPKRRNEERDLTAADWRVIGALLVVMLITIFQSVAYLQNGNVLLVWVQEHVALNMGPFNVPVPWFASLDALASIVGVPALFWLWRWQGSRGGEPGDLTKIGTGAAITAASNLILVFGTVAAGGARLSPLWPILYCIGVGIAFLYYWPTLLAMVSRAAPAKVNATMMGIAFVSLFVANMIIGRIGGFYEAMGPIAFWSMHAAIGAGGAVLVLIFGRWLSRTLDYPSSAAA
jgi:POT family proton-dependent oligopeptide transporter